MQFVQVIILYTHTANIADQQLVFVDLGGVVPITILLCWTQANSVLINKRPPGSLFSWTIILSTYGEVLIQSAFIFGMFMALRYQNFYEPTERSHDETTDGHESTTTFYVTMPQYVFIGIAFHTATRFRQAIWTNIPFMFLLSIQLALIGWIILGPQKWIRDALDLAVLDFYFRYTLIGSGLLNGFISIMYEWTIQATVGKREMEQQIEFGGKGRLPNAPKTASHYIPQSSHHGSVAGSHRGSHVGSHRNY